MRKNSPRKWLHAILDLLPVLILPIFALAVRSDNNFQPIEVLAQDYEVVDFNQLIKESDSLVSGITFNDGLFDISVDNQTSDYIYLRLSSSFDIKAYHKYLFKYEPIQSLDPNNVNFFIFLNGGSYQSLTYNDNEKIITESATFTSYASIQVPPNYTNHFTFYLDLFDLTQMFGSGNEPTTQQFDTWYPNDYYEYTLSKKELLNVGTTTLSDTDVGSQMVYTLYNATDKYFNFNNVFNFGQIYDWFVLNIFNGSATLIFPVVWQIVLYEFIMDLVFLIYALFMFFIDFCTNLIDRFHVKCSGGK